MHIEIKKGLNLPISGAPEQVIEARETTSVALIGFDYVGLKPKMLIEEGQQVRLGQAMFQDKTNPDVVFTAPGAGLVKAITRGHRRVLQSVVIELSGDDQETWEVLGGGGEKALDAAKVREVLRASGLWTALRARPFSKIPPIDGQPYAVFVTAIDTSPLAADPGLVMRGREKEFTAGLSALGTLTPGKVHVCTGPGLNPAIPESGQFNHAQFSGPHPAGLVGTHIHMLSPVGAKRTVWHIGYQDVIEIGHLLLTGRRDPSRVIALAGPKVKRPRLIRTRLGASTRELLKDELSAGASRVISGSVLSGRRASDWSAYLGRYHTQISVIGDDVERKFLAFSRPGPEKFSVTRTFASSWFGGRKLFNFTTSQEGSPRAMVPIGSYEAVMPMDILPTQLLRAILVQDTDSAQSLGCLELDEEDLALCSYVCPSKYDFGPVLRSNLEIIEREG
jgi:Na+-transporting NADH:ubiquinone oxidoreductase subunit A